MAGNMLGELFVAIKGDTKQFDTAIDQSETKATKAAARLEAVGKKLTSAGKKMSMMVTLPVVALGGAFIKAASDLEETTGKFKAVFKEQADDVDKWAEDFAGSVNRAKGDQLKFLATIQDTLVPLGFARDAAADYSKAAVTLATDLASFNNLPTEQVVSDIQSALVGNVEVVRKYGVVVNQATIKQEALNQGIWDGTSEMDAQTKAAATWAIIMRSTSDAQGDAIRTADSFANQLRGLKAAVGDLAETWGAMLIPIAKKVVGVVTNIANWFKNLSDTTKKLVLMFGGILATIGPALLIFGKLAIIVKTLIPIFGAVKLAVMAFTASLSVNPIFLVITAIAALGTAIYLLTKNLQQKNKEQLGAIDLQEKSKGLTREETKAILEQNVARQREILDRAEAGRLRLQELKERTEALKKNTTGLNAMGSAMSSVDKKIQEHEENLKAYKQGLSEAGDQLEDYNKETERLNNLKKEEEEKQRKAQEALENHTAGLEAGAEKAKDFGEIQSDVLENLADQYRIIEEKAKVYGDAINENALKADALKTAIDKLISEGFEAENEIVQELTRTYNQLVSEIERVKNEEENLARTTKLLFDENKEIDEQWKAQNDVLAQLADKFRIIDEQVKIYGETIDADKEKTAALNTAINELLAEGFEAESSAVQVLVDLLGDYGEATKTLTVDWEAMTKKIITFAQTMANGIKNIFDELTLHNQTNLDNEYNREKKRLEARYTNEDDLAEAIKELDEEFEGRRQEMAVKEAKAAKAFAIFNSIINTIQGVTAALASANIPLSILIGALGAVQTGMIAARPIPQFATGGSMITQGPQTAMFGDNPSGMEEVEATPIPVGETEGTGPGKMIHLTVQLGSQVLYDDIEEAIRDRQIVIERSNIA